MASLTQPENAVLPAPTFSQRGFTLTEMAVVLVIVALLIGSMILPLSAQQDMRYTEDTRRLMAEVSEALYGYAASHAAGNGKPFLPCPDTDGNGTENRVGNACANQEGGLPWADLGLGRQDAWGNPLRYRVTAAFSSSATGFVLLSAGDLRVCETNACAVTLGSALPAVIVSPGKNGAGTTTNVDELENLDGDTDFVLRLPGDTTGFDDLVVWLPQSILLNRMVSAGRLP
jgi:prepilin-type N-terminal cleavage/methylation domain-containing protein